MPKEIRDEIRRIAKAREKHRAAGEKLDQDLRAAVIAAREGGHKVSFSELESLTGLTRSRLNQIINGTR